MGILAGSSFAALLPLAVPLLNGDLGAEHQQIGVFHVPRNVVEEMHAPVFVEEFFVEFAHFVGRQRRVVGAFAAIQHAVQLDELLLLLDEALVVTRPERLVPFLDGDATTAQLVGGIRFGAFEAGGLATNDRPEVGVTIRRTDVVAADGVWFRAAGKAG